MSRVRAVLLDYGHTLVDFARPDSELLEAYHRVNQRLERELECEVPAATDLIEQVSHRVDHLIGESYRSGSEQEVDIAALYEQTLSAIGLHLSAEMVQWVVDEEQYAWFTGLLKGPTVDATLEELRRRGVKLCIVSNAAFPPHTMRWQMEKLDLLHRFDATVFSSELGIRKPNRAIYEEALRLVAEPADACLFVGDRVREDVRGPGLLGIASVLTHEFRQEAPEPDQAVPVIQRLDALLDRVT